MKTAVFSSTAAMRRALGAGFWTWPNFTPSEIACRDGSIMVDTEAMDKLQALRQHIGQPFKVHSAYRSPAHNRAVGGARLSEHMQAEAFDIDMSNHDPHVFEAAARAYGFHGIGRYSTGGNWFLHIDTRPESEAATWGQPFPGPAPAPAKPLPAPHDALKAKPKAEAPPPPDDAPEAPPEPRLSAPRGRGGFFRRIMDMGR